MRLTSGYYAAFVYRPAFHLMTLFAELSRLHVGNGSTTYFSICHAKKFWQDSRKVLIHVLPMLVLMALTQANRIASHCI